MTLDVWQGFVQDQDGDTVSSAEVEVRLSSDGSLATLYSDNSGNTGKSNPFTTGADGFVQFYTFPDELKITATKGSDTVTFNNVMVGKATRVVNTTHHNTGTDAAAASHPGISVGHVIETNYHDSNRVDGSGARFSYTGTTAVGKAGNWPDTATGKFYDADGKEFDVIEPNVLKYGAAGDYFENGTDDTQAFQTAFVAWYVKGGRAPVCVPPGDYLVKDEITAGVTADGKTVAKHIADGDISQSNPDYGQVVALLGHYKQSWIIVDETFSSTDSNFIDKVVMRYESPSKKITAPVIEGISFYADITRGNRKKCPVAFKGINLNFSVIRDFIARGKEFEWTNTAIHIENINNSYAENWRVKAGYQPTVADMWGAGGQFDIELDGGGDPRISSNDSSDPFANPGDEANSFWDGLYLLLGNGASNNAEMVLTKTASSSAKANNNLLNLDPTFAPPNTSVTGINVSFAPVHGSMTSGNNALTIDSPVLDSDDEGRMVHVFQVGVAGDSEREILSAYIKPGSITSDGKGCELVHSDGTTVANAQTTRNNQPVVFNPGVYIGQSAENIGDGHNNDTTFAGCHVEKSRGTQMLLENVLGCHFLSGKTHGRNAAGNYANQQFSECGYLMVFDTCTNVSFDNWILTWFEGIDSQVGDVFGVRLYGNRNHIRFNSYELFGAADTAHLFDLRGTGSDVALSMGDGLNNIVDWGVGANDRQLFSFASGYGAHNIDVNGKLKLRETGGPNGYEDQLGPYRRTEFGAGSFVTIASGEIECKGSYLIVDTEGDASSDDVDTITNGRPGQEIVIGKNVAGRNVVLKHGTGNLVLPGGTDITLGENRDNVKMIYRDDNNEWYVVGV